MDKKLKIFGSVAAAASLVNAQKKKKIDIASWGKMAVQAVKLPIPQWEQMENGQAQTPPMGWSSWNLFRNHIHEDLIYEIGRAMKDSGLLDAGYQYLNLDDCWQSSSRDADGRLQGDLASFPGGIQALRERVNALGLKLGIYSSNGTLTCEDLPASLGNEALDADTFAGWGIEYFKYDFCHNKAIPSRAPCIEKLHLRHVASGKEYVQDTADAVLSGGARIVADSKLSSGKYIDGLSAGLGSAEFCFETDAAGEYVLTLVLRKKSNAYKYAEIEINGDRVYPITVPPTWAATADARHQISVTLNQGFNVIKIFNPVVSRQLSSAMQYRNMGKQLQRATREYAEKNGVPERKICYSICEWGFNFPWKWGRYAGNLWRTTPDIKPCWASILSIYEWNVRLAKYASPGHWNDPDMLEVGNGNLTEEENKTHFTLWCMMAAPLILGNDVRNFVKPDGTPNTDDPTYRIVTNKALIALDQDPLGIQCRRVKTSGIVDTLVKPLDGAEAAICVLNKSSDAVCRSIDVRQIACSSFSGLPVSALYSCTELWEDTVYETDGTLSFKIPAHGVKVFRVKALHKDKEMIH